ncbi:MAG: pilus assembly protein [Bowdeniella nasicola]|nr:pilus assembly protein [Bowdeniella nasicola]
MNVPTLPQARATRGERGGITVEFTLTLLLAIAVFAAITQLIFAMHVRAIVSDCLREGARHAALANGDLASGRDYTHQLLHASLNSAYSATVQVSLTREWRSGLEVVHANAEAPLPLVGLVGPERVMQLDAYAVSETQFLD